MHRPYGVRDLFAVNAGTPDVDDTEVTLCVVVYVRDTGDTTVFGGLVDTGVGGTTEA